MESGIFGSAASVTKAPFREPLKLSDFTGERILDPSTNSPSLRGFSRRLDTFKIRSLQCSSRDWNNGTKVNGKEIGKNQSSKEVLRPWKAVCLSGIPLFLPNSHLDRPTERLLSLPKNPCSAEIRKNESHPKVIGNRRKESPSDSARALKVFHDCDLRSSGFESATFISKALTFMNDNRRFRAPSYRIWNTRRAMIDKNPVSYVSLSVV